jgi:hypothetical protein
MKLLQLLESRGRGRSYTDVKKSIDRGETTFETLHTEFCNEELLLAVEYAKQLIARGIEMREAVGISNQVFRHVARADIEPLLLR